MTGIEDHWLLTATYVGFPNDILIEELCVQGVMSFKYRAKPMNVSEDTAADDCMFGLKFEENMNDCSIQVTRLWDWFEENDPTRNHLMDPVLFLQTAGLDV